MGEENRDWGGAFAVYRGLTEALPYHRLFNSPISEVQLSELQLVMECAVDA